MKRLPEVLTGILMCDVEALPSSTPLSEIEGWDSLKHVMLVVGLEANFAVSLSAEEIKAMATIGDISRILKEKGVDD
jgi:acyl carrier protein